MTTAIILAGGLGTRLREAVPDVPKPMAPILGKPFLEHQMNYWAKQGVSRFILLVGYMGHVIVDHFGSEFNGISVDYEVEDTPLGTGGGLLRMTDKLGDQPCLIMNGDTFFDVDLYAFKKSHASQEADWSIALFRTDEAGRYMGVDIESDGRITNLKSGTKKLGQLVNGGIYLVSPSVLKWLSFGKGAAVSLEDEILPEIIQENGRVFGSEFTGGFIDIGVPTDYHRAEEILPKMGREQI